MNKTKSTKTIITTIALMAMMINIGMMVATTQKVFAMNNVVRYINGQNTAWETAGWQYLNHPTKAQMDHYKNLDLAFLGTPQFQSHSEAYKNGFISEIDMMYHLQLPYVEYNLQTPSSGHIDQNAPVVITPHYMGISVLSH